MSDMKEEIQEKAYKSVPAETWEIVTYILLGIGFIIALVLMLTSDVLIGTRNIFVFLFCLAPALLAILCFRIVITTIITIRKGKDCYGEVLEYKNGPKNKYGYEQIAILRVDDPDGVYIMKYNLYKVKQLIPVGQTVTVRRWLKFVRVM